MQNTMNPFWKSKRLLRLYSLILHYLSILKYWQRGLVNRVPCTTECNVPNVFSQIKRLITITWHHQEKYVRYVIGKVWFSSLQLLKMHGDGQTAHNSQQLCFPTVALTEIVYIGWTYITIRLQCHESDRTRWQSKTTSTLGKMRSKIFE